MKLTIYIPTYQRYELDNCLASIMSQITDDVEVIVSDNDPNGFARHIAARFDNIEYQSRIINIGCDPNCLLGTTQGTGEYVWIIDDDDWLLDGAVAATLEMCDGVVDRIIHYTPSCGEVPVGYIGAINGMLDLLHDKSFLLAATCDSVNIWRRNIFDLSLGIKHLDTHNVLAWTGLKCVTMKVADQPLVKAAPAVRGTHPSFESVMTDYLDALSAYHNLPPLVFADVNKWNFAQP